uniref:MatE protein n=1 Tax=Candidatus Kentrum sp. UNK TaxID=2126344 RepID=A0A451AQN0_9GAMM|nr:MAG: MatE protein [Candidatus Kentron sp. UNK]VFK73598.1 MAG: MatE protein [Candidatus Kentron sp. UNK]
MSTSKLPNASELRAVLKIALPSTLGILAQIAIGVIDNIMVGHLGMDELGGVGLASSVYSVIFMMGWGCSSPSWCWYPRPEAPVACGWHRS